MEILILEKCQESKPGFNETRSLTAHGKRLETIKTRKPPAEGTLAPACETHQIQNNLGGLFSCPSQKWGYSKALQGAGGSGGRQGGHDLAWGRPLGSGWAGGGQGLGGRKAEGTGRATGRLHSEQQPQGPALEPEGHLLGGVALDQISASLKVISHLPWGSWETRQGREPAPKPEGTLGPLMFAASSVVRAQHRGRRRPGQPFQGAGHKTPTRWALEEPAAWMRGEDRGSGRLPGGVGLEPGQGSETRTREGFRTI